MKHIPTFESFVNENLNLNEAYGPSMLDNRGVFDDDVIDFTWEDAATWAFGQNLGLKSKKEIEKLSELYNALPAQMKILHRRSVLMPWFYLQIENFIKGNSKK